MRENLQRLLVKGGVLSPSELKQILEMAESFGLETLHFGSRQDIILPKVVDKDENRRYFHKWERIDGQKRQRRQNRYEPVLKS